jgi:uncharacterized protein (DUF4415 family)
MSEEHIVRYTREHLPEDTETDWDRVKRMSEEEIEKIAREDPDNPPTTEEFWKDATIVWPKEKQHISLRLDYDLYWWLKEYAKQEGKSYQRLINAILRTWIEAQKAQRVKAQAPNSPGRGG